MAKRTRAGLKHARQSARRRLKNRERKLALKDTLKKIRAAKTKDEAQKLYTEAQSVIDRSARHHVIRKNTAGRLKSRLSREIALLK